jgi:hypothetical protein
VQPTGPEQAIKAGGRVRVKALHAKSSLPPKGILKDTREDADKIFGDVRQGEQ